jgi:hypothetical protein
MERSKNGKSAYLKIGIWKKGRLIHVTGKGKKKFHISIGPDPEKPNGHPVLYQELDAVLSNKSAE